MKWANNYLFNKFCGENWIDTVKKKTGPLYYRKLTNVCKIIHKN